MEINPLKLSLLMLAGEQGISIDKKAAVAGGKEIYVDNGHSGGTKEESR